MKMLYIIPCKNLVFRKCRCIFHHLYAWLLLIIHKITNQHIQSCAGTCDIFNTSKIFRYALSLTQSSLSTTLKNSPVAFRSPAFTASPCRLFLMNDSHNFRIFLSVFICYFRCGIYRTIINNKNFYFIPSTRGINTFFI